MITNTIIIVVIIALTAIGALEISVFAHYRREEDLWLIWMCLGAALYLLICECVR